MLKKDYLKSIEIFTIICLLFCVITKVLFRVPTKVLLIFFVSQHLFIFLPGFAVIYHSPLTQTSVESISLGYTIGYCINILEYFFLYLLQIEKYGTVFLSLIAGFSIIALLFRKPKCSYFHESNNKVLMLIFGIYMIINIIAYSGNSVAPWSTVQGLTEIPRDVQFWCSNAVSLKNSFPPNAAFFTKSTLFYHYFSSIQIGFLSKITGIDVYSMAFTLYPFGKCIIFFGAFNFLLDQFKVGRYKYFLLSMILFMSGKEMIPVVTYTWHTILFPFGFDLGFAFGAWYLGTFIHILKRNSYEKKLIVINILLWAVCCGIKAPVASVLIFVPFFYCCVWLTNHKLKWAICYGATILGLFLLINVVCAGMMRTLTGASAANGESFSIAFYPIEELIEFSEFGRIGGLGLSIACKLYWAHPVLCIITTLNLVVFLRYTTKKEIEIQTSILTGVMLAVLIIGIVLGIFINAGGHSEMYFFMTAYIPAIIFNSIVIESCWVKIEVQNNRYAKSAVPILLSCLGVYGICLMTFASYNGGLASSLREGAERILGKGSYSGDSFTKNEADVCRWISSNTDENTVVLSDRYTQDGNQGLYYYSIFTERAQFLEATDLLIYVDLKDKNTLVQREVERRMDLVTLFFENDELAAEILKSEGVQYVIHNSRITPGFIYNENCLNQVYSSGELTVYKMV